MKYKTLIVGFLRGRCSRAEGNWGTLRIRREDGGTLGKIRGITNSPLKNPITQCWLGMEKKQQMVPNYPVGHVKFVNLKVSEPPSTAMFFRLFMSAMFHLYHVGQMIHDMDAHLGLKTSIFNQGLHFAVYLEDHPRTWIRG